MPLQNELRRELGPWQIFMIVVSTTVGVGFFTSSGETLALAGPGATILAFGVIGLVAWGAMDGLSEMVVFWPVPNPLVQFVQTFVDRELGTVVHFAYWYTYAISTAAIITSAGQLVQYWSGPEANATAAQVLVFITFPIIILLVNCLSVKVFGWIEFFGGSLKLLMVITLTFIMLLIDWGVHLHPANMNKCIKDGFVSSVGSNSKASAAVIAMSLAVFPYIGVETFTITAFEAKSANTMKLPSRIMAPFITLLYTLSVLGFTLNVPWNNGYLPNYYDATRQNDPDISQGCYDLIQRHLPRETSISSTTGHVLPVIAIDLANIRYLPGFVNACLLYSALSTANSCSFIASRVLHSFVHTHTEPKSLSFFARLNDQGSPVWAVLASLVFCWVPFLSFIPGDKGESTQRVLMSLGSTSCVLVWAAQCLAYIRCRSWLAMYPRELQASDDYRMYYPHREKKLYDFPSRLQPVLAWVSGILCVVIVLGFPIAGLKLDSDQRVDLIGINTYLGPGICLVLFLLLKVYKLRINEQGWVRLGSWNELRDVIQRLLNNSFQNSDMHIRMQDLNGSRGSRNSTISLNSERQVHGSLSQHQT